jgi:hypothetical protein
MSTKPGLNHAKVALIDDDWLMVLWANLDVRSMRLNFELNAPDPGRCNGRQFGASAEGRFQNLQADRRGRGCAAAPLAALDREPGSPAGVPA